MIHDLTLMIHCAKYYIIYLSKNTSLKMATIGGRKM